MEDPCGSFYNEFCGSDIIYTQATSLVTLLESHDPNVIIFGTKYIGFPVKLGYY